MENRVTENTVEEAALELFGILGYTILHGPNIAPDELFAERAGYADVVLIKRLREALARINPRVPAEALDEAVRKTLRTETPKLEENNRRFHRSLIEGLQVEYRNDEGRVVYGQVNLVDFDDPANNDWLAVNQFTVVENKINRRPDIVVFLNGLPLGVIELKNLADENATIRDAFNQLQTYKGDIPSLFTYNEALVISDGIEARLGTLTAGWERFMPWRTVEGDDLAPKGSLALEVLLRGVFDKKRFLDLVRHFVVFEDASGTLAKKMAGYHQFHAVNKAVACTLKAASAEGDRRVGVVWHTQGSGKSLTMAFYAGKIIQHPEMANPTLVVLTDRNDLDNQLFGTFSACEDLLRQAPEQAESRDDLKARLQRSSGGAVFTTIQKFLPDEKGERYPLLSDRRNIVVIADEAHRSQYGFIEGFARHMRDALPNASFIGFTATPIEADDRSTPAVFGEYIDVYDIQRAIEDGCHGAHLLRRPAGQAGAKGRGAAQNRPRVRGGHRRRRAHREGKTQDEVGAHGSHGGHREARRPDCPGHCGPLRATAGGDGRQGDDRLHEPPHLCRPLQRARHAEAQLARKRGRPGSHQGSDDRFRG